MIELPSDLEPDRRRLEELLSKTGAFQYSPDRPFQLASGATSEYYFDLRLLSADPEGLSVVAKIFYHHIKSTMPDVKSVGGIESGSIPIVAAISHLSYLEHRKDPTSPPLTSFYVRKAAKAHGTKKPIEGRIASPAVTIIDDVITSGASAMAAVRAAKEQGHQCRSLMAVIFRGTDESRRDIEKACRLEYVLDKDQLVGRFKELHGRA